MPFADVAEIQFNLQNAVHGVNDINEFSSASLSDIHFLCFAVIAIDIDPRKIENAQHNAR